MRWSLGKQRNCYLRSDKNWLRSFEFDLNYTLVGGHSITKLMKNLRKLLFEFGHPTKSEILIWWSTREWVTWINRLSKITRRRQLDGFDSQVYKLWSYIINTVLVTPVLQRFEVASAIESDLVHHFISTIFWYQCATNFEFLNIRKYWE